MPAALAATENACLPRFSFFENGDVHAEAFPSSEHSKVEPATEEVNSNETFAFLLPFLVFVLFFGVLVRVVSGVGDRPAGARPACRRS